MNLLNEYDRLMLNYKRKSIFLWTILKKWTFIVFLYIIIDNILKDTFSKLKIALKDNFKGKRDIFNNRVKV